MRVHIPFALTILWLHIERAFPYIRPLLKRFDVYNRLEKWLNEGDIMKSRKMRVLLWMVVLSTFGAFVPPIVCWLMDVVFHHPVQPLVILTDGDWITVVSIVVPAYMGMVTWDKHIALSNGILPQNIDSTIMNIKEQNTQQQISDSEKQALRDALKHDQ